MAMTQAQLREACPAFYYRPNTAASEEFIVSHGGSRGSLSKGDTPFFESDASRRVAIGGNRSGKSTKLVLEAGAFCIGCRPWYPPDNEWFRRGLPEQPRLKRVRVHFVVSNFDTQLNEILDELGRWWPEVWYDKIKVDGKVRQINWLGGQGVWYFLSHKQFTEDFEGIETDLAVWNEPPPKDKWVALHRGLVSSGGRAIVGATPLTKSDWFWNDVINPNTDGVNRNYLITYHSIWDNCAENGGCATQKAENVAAFLEDVADPDERLAREHGHPMHLAGLILKDFRPEQHLIDPFPLPENAMIVGGIDPAGSKPFAGLFCAYLPDPKLGWVGHFFDEVWVPQTRSDLGLFCDIWQVKDRRLRLPDIQDPRQAELVSEYVSEGPFHPQMAQYTMIDPFAEEVQKADRAAGISRTMRRILMEDYGINTIRADRRGKVSRLLNLNSKFREGHYRIWKNCRRFRMEQRAWKWDADSAKLTAGPDDVSDCSSYIDSTNPGKALEQASKEMLGGIYIPNDADVSQFAAIRQMERENRWKVWAERGLTPDMFNS